MEFYIYVGLNLLALILLNLRISNLKETIDDLKKKVSEMGKSES